VKETSGDLTGEDSEFGWVNYFMTLRGNEFFCQVEDEYIRDNFNLTGLVSQVQYYHYALDVIRDIENDKEFAAEHLGMIEHDAEVLYGLIHARYILSNRGLYAMLDKFLQNEFGSCPRVMCNHQSLLPLGLTEMKGRKSVKLYCGQCEDVFNCKSSRHKYIDGAYFGTTFPHLFFLVFPELKPKNEKQIYVPRIYGFRLDPTSYQRSLEARQQFKEEQRVKQSKGNKQ